jgi:hypothetical protein
MATLSQGPRLNARTTRRIHTAIKHAALNATVAGVTFQGRDVSSEALISAILAEFIEISREDQIAFLRPALAKLEKELS